MAGDTRIELVLRDSKSPVLPLHKSPTESRIVKEQYVWHDGHKQKTLWTYHLRGFW